MIYTVFGKEDEISLVSKKLEDLGHIRDDLNPEYIFSIGGDGTILQTVHKYIDMIDHVKIIGINYGKLGFYTDFSKDEGLEILDILDENSNNVAEYSLLEYKLISDNEEKVYYALNELAIINPIHTQIIDVYINDIHFETFRGSGLIVSTPTGSTAFNKSVGGSIIDPSIKAIQLAEVAPINNRVFSTISSPIVLSSNTKVILKSNFEKTTVSFDGIIDDFKQANTIEIKLSKKTVKFISKNDSCFWDRVRKSFLV